MADEPSQSRYFLGLTPDEMWRIYLNEGMPGLQKAAPSWMRLVMAIENGMLKSLPSDPRCMWCYAPFRGIGAPLMRAMGKSQSRLNPNLCADCENIVHKHSGGAEVGLTILFADLRGSTALAEGTSPAEFRRLINRFYSTATKALIDENALIEKLIGDEVTAFFVPGLAGARHARRALDAADKILLETGHADAEGPWAPVGIGLHSGVAYVGVVGHADGVTNLSVLGDVANTAARLASEAAAGEILFSREAAENAGIDTTGLETRRLALKGKSEPFQTWVITVDRDIPPV